MFHVQNGLFFQRMLDGEVRVIKTYDGRSPGPDNVIVDEVMTRAAFASVASSMSERGETTASYFEFLGLLQQGS